MIKTYESIIDINLPLLSKVGKRVCNLKFINNDGQVNLIKGNTFLVDITSNQYFHFVVDCIGQYEFLKKTIKNLQICFVSDYSHNVKYHFETSQNSFVKDIATIYNINSEDVLCLKESNVEFENIYYFNNVFNNFINDFDGNNILYWHDGDDFINYNLKIISALRKKFIPMIEKRESKKIFITRRKENEKLIRIRHLYNKHKFDAASQDERYELSKELAKFGGVNSVETNVLIRIQEREDLDAMESFFKDNGYEIVDPGSYSFIEQISLFHNASHIASMKGTGLTNSIFANDDSHIIIINPNTQYIFWYDQIGYFVSKNCHEVPVMQCDLSMYQDKELGTFSIDNIIARIKEIM